MISVIIPCYNLEKYIGRTIESIINQTHSDWEMIIVDDGSVDNSKDICEKYCREYPNKIRLISQENKGVSVARNSGIEVAKGDYICLLDGDDFLGKECFKSVMEKFNENLNLDICAYGYQDISEEGIISGKYEESRLYPDKALNASDALLLKCMRQIWICTGSAVYKTEMIKKYNIRYREGYKYGEDLNFINACISRAREIDYVHNIYFNCLLRTGSATRSGINSSYIHASELNRILLKEIESRIDLSIDEKEQMILACNIDYINVTTAAAKNIVENLGTFEAKKARKLYKDFGIVAHKFDVIGIKSRISKAKLIEWTLFEKNKDLFFYSVKLYNKLRGSK